MGSFGGENNRSKLSDIEQNGRTIRENNEIRDLYARLANPNHSVEGRLAALGQLRGRKGLSNVERDSTDVYTGVLAKEVARLGEVRADGQLWFVEDGKLRSRLP